MHETHFTTFFTDKQKIQPTIMKHTSRFTTAATLLLAVLITTFGCKSSTSDPGPANLTTLQGSWKITGITVDPAYTYLGISVKDLSSALTFIGETCLSDAVITFNANGTISNNVATQPSCAKAPTTITLINTFFGPTTTYKESGNQATLVTSTQTINGTNVFTPTTATYTAKLNTDPGGNPVPTTYTVVLTKQ